MDRLIETAAGALTLERREEAEGSVWFANGFVIYKADAGSRAVVAAYMTVPDGERGRPIDAMTVAPDGDVVAMSQAQVTRIAAHEAHCVDRNGNGLVETSHAWDEVLPLPASELWDDECILWTSPIPSNPNGLVVTESIILDGIEERVWIGLTDEQRYIELDAANGEATGRDMPTPGIWPSSAVVDAAQYVWTGSYGGETIGVFDPHHLEAGLESFITNEGSIVAIDENDDIWVSGGNVQRFDRSTGFFDPVFAPEDLDKVPLGFGYMTSDGEGNMWQAVTTERFVNRIDIETLEWESFPLPYGLAYNVGVDSYRQLWIQSLEVDNEAPHAWVLDLATREMVRALDECLSCASLHSVGDFTTFTRTLLQEQNGLWTRGITACEAGDAVHWSGIRGSARVPGGSAIELWIRTGVDAEELWEGPWRRVGLLSDGESTLDLARVLDEETLTHRHLALQARLTAGRAAGAPELSWVEVQWGCEAPVQ